MVQFSKPETSPEEEFCSCSSGAEEETDGGKEGRRGGMT